MLPCPWAMPAAKPFCALATFCAEPFSSLDSCPSTWMMPAKCLSSSAKVSLTRFDFRPLHTASIRSGTSPSWLRSWIRFRARSARSPACATIRGGSPVSTLAMTVNAFPQ